MIRKSLDAGVGTRAKDAGDAYVVESFLINSMNAKRNSFRNQCSKGMLKRVTAISLRMFKGTM